MKVLHIPADESKPFAIVEIKGEDDSLKQKQKLVGGYIEYVPLGTNEVAVIVNEDGISLNLPLNFRAWHLVGILAQKTHTPDMSIMNPILGDVIVLGGTNADGDSLDVPEYVIKALEGVKR